VLAVDHDGPVGTDPFMGVAFVTPETIPVAQLSLVDAAGGTRPLRS
jgi:hypothetical protein